MSLFENFPYTNLHELNLDWLIKELKEVKESAVISVNGQTGEVILYQDAEVRFPTVDVGGVWEMVRAVDGDTDAGIRFTAEGVTYIIKGSRARRIYDEDNQPPYPVTSVNEQTGDVTITFPVTSVNGQTGAITLYQDQYVVLPPLTGDQLQNWNFYRYVNNVLHGIQFDNDGRAYIMNGSGRYQIYTEHNPQPFTFVDNVNNDIMTISPDAQYGSWGLLRETDSGTVGIVFSFDSATPTPYMRYTVMEGGQPVTRSVKLLTPADIPSSSGVVSVNGLAGVVTITGDNINRDGNTAQTIADALTAIEGKSNTAYNSLAYIENTDQTSHNINSGEYVLWHGGLYKATSNISIGAVLSSSNLTAVSNGGFNSLNEAIANKLQSFGYVQSPDMTRQQVMALNPTDLGNIYGYICNYGYTQIIGFVHKTQEYGGQLRLTYTDGIQYRRYNNGTWAAWQELAPKNDFTPSAFTAPTNLGSGVYVDKGGYVQVGNMVVVNCRLNLGSAIQSNIAKFPASGLTSTHVSVANNKGIDMGIDQNGYLNAGASVSTGILVISTTYFCMS